MTSLNFSYPDGFGAVSVVHKLIVDRILARCAVMMESIPFNAAADPSAEHTHICRLDYMLAVENLVAVGFIGSVEESSAYTRQNAELDVIVLKIESVMR